MSYMSRTIHGGTIEHNWEKHHELKEGEVFVEVGGYYGRYGVVAAERGARVFLVEPAPGNRAEIEKTMQEFSRTFTVVPKAVGSAKGVQKFVVYGNPSGWRLAQDGDSVNYPDDIIEVEVDTLEGILDGLGVDHVDLLASDCENQEVQMMEHAGRWLDQKLIRNIAIGAYHNGNNPRLITEILEKKGYEDISWEDDSVLYARAP